MLKKIDQANFDPVYAIMEEAFPPSERRPYPFQIAQLDKEIYTVYGYEYQGQLAGFFSLWDFEPFVYCEFFAIAADFRNDGIGGQCLQAMLAQLNKPFVLEVEEPETSPMAQRRIGFYQRNGLHLTDIAYVQPQLHPGDPDVPLRLMSWPEPLSPQDFQAIRREFFQVVYDKQPRGEA